MIAAIAKFLVCGGIFGAVAYYLYKYATRSDAPVETPTRPGTPGKPPAPK